MQFIMKFFRKTKPSTKQPHQQIQQPNSHPQSTENNPVNKQPDEYADQSSEDRQQRLDNLLLQLLQDQEDEIDINYGIDELQYLKVDNSLIRKMEIEKMELDDRIKMIQGEERVNNQTLELCKGKATVLQGNKKILIEKKFQLQEAIMDMQTIDALQKQNLTFGHDKKKDKEEKYNPTPNTITKTKIQNFTDENITKKQLQAQLSQINNKITQFYKKDQQIKTLDNQIQQLLKDNKKDQVKSLQQEVLILKNELLKQEQNVEMWNDMRFQLEVGIMDKKVEENFKK